MFTAWVGAAALACYGGLSAFAIRRLLFPGIGRPCPALPPWMQSARLCVEGIDTNLAVFLPDRVGRVCVLQHGLGECVGVLSAEADLLRRLGYGIVMMDLPGHGESSRAATTYGVREARMLRGALDALGVADRVTVVWGRSVGAAAVLRLATTLPGIRSIILDCMFDNPLGSILRHAIRRPRLRPLLPLVPGVLGSLSLFLLARGAFSFPVDVVHLVDVPILFITGSKDVGMPPTVQRRLLARARHPKSRLIVVPEARHYGCFPRAPEVFEEWLVEVTSTAERQRLA